MKFKSNIESQAGIEDSAGSAGTDGKILSSLGVDGNGVAGVEWIDQGDVVAGEADKAKSVILRVKNSTLSAMTKGQVICENVSISPPNGNLIEVALADNNAAGRMPALGILNEDLDASGGNNDEGDAIMFGKVSGIDTSAFQVGDEVFVSDAPGGLTTTKPTGVKYIQKVGVVIRDDNTNGTIEVFGAGRVNDVPTPLYVDHANQRLGIGTITPDAKLEVVGTTGVIIDSGSSSAAKLTLIGDGNSYGGGGTIDIIGGASDYMTYSLNLKRSPNTPEAFNRYFQYNNTWEWDGNIGGTTAQPYTSYDFKTQGSSQMVIYNNNVGIGTTSPGSQIGSTKILDISSNGNGEVILDHTDAGTTSDIGLYSWNRNNDHLAHIKATCDGATDAAFISFHTQATGGSFLNPSSNEKMRIESSGNVGIGTNNPLELLHLRSTGPARLLIEADSDNVTETDNAQIILKQDGGAVIGRLGYRTNTNDLELLNEYTSNIYLGTSNSIRATLHANGDFGIGNQTPQAKLHVSNGLLRTWAPTSGTSAIFESTVSNRNFVTLTAANEAELWFGNAATQAKGRVRYEMANNNMEFWTNATQKMVIDGSGDVGIGTTNPNAKLEVAGSTRITGTGLDVGYGNNGTNYVQVGFGRTTNGFAVLDLIGDSTYTDYGFRILRNNGGPNTDTDILHRGTGDLDLKTVEAGDIGFHTTSIQRMIVKSDGDVGIGTTNPSQKLHVVGRVASTAGNGFEIINSYGSPRLSDFYGSFMTTGPLYVGGSYSGSAQPCNASAFNITSDYRLKENEAPLTEASSRIKKLKPIRFNYISSENTVDGFLAHEVAEVVPEAVTGEKDAVREDGSDELQGLDLSKIVPLLTAALQESITKIEQLEQRIQTLENK